MPIGINGSGTITGLSAGGLPDGTITSDDIAAAAVTPAKLSTGAPSWTSGGDLSFNSGYGSVATAYGCRAWVNFNGTGTVAIRASGNVSSITDNGTGDYTVNFTTAMPDANYNVIGCAGQASAASSMDVVGRNLDNSLQTTSAVRLYTLSTSAAARDNPNVSVSIFR